MADNEKELVLAPNEYAYVQDKNKGNIQALVGPYKTPLSATDQPVIFNEDYKRFQSCSLEQAIHTFPVAPEGWYIVLKNPASNPQQQHPMVRGSSDLVDLSIGKKIIVPGPCSFPLWPGQMARILEGHRLRSNQYLLISIYDAEEVKANPAALAQIGVVLAEGDPPPDVVNGDLFVIEGSDVSFYIPPTGIEVVPYYDEDEEQDVYIRDAVTLECLEYCILLDENGNKEYIQGPDVVFPSPTESFLEDENGFRKFRAVELSGGTSGIYAKVIEAYDDVEIVEIPATASSEAYLKTKVIAHHPVGEELFITGEDQMIYFPRSEHAIIKYGDRTVHHAVAIPEGEARYVLNRNTGEVRLQRGPCMFLPDPRYEVIVKRVLDAKTSELLFPGNLEAIRYNESLKKLSDSAGYVTDESLAISVNSMPHPQTMYASAKSVQADSFKRSSSFTPPRTITLDTKYDGAVTIEVYTGYAIQVVNKSGKRKVVVGPATHLLEYDEHLEVMGLSTGTPKSNDQLYKTAYLRIANNKVTDIIFAETKDFCRVNIKVSYSINFEGDLNKWFMTENYIKLLCDRMRSLVRSKVKQYSIEEFYSSSIDIVRDIILGPAVEGKVAGRSFPENDMIIYDVDILDTQIQDKDINTYLVSAQRNTFTKSLQLAAMKRDLEITAETERIKQETQELQHTTEQAANAIKLENIASKLNLDLAELNKTRTTNKEAADLSIEKANAELAIAKIELQQEVDAKQLNIEIAKQELALELEKLQAQVEAVVQQHATITPDLIAALQAIGDKYLLQQISKDMAPLAILGGKSIAEVFNGLLANCTPFMAGLATSPLLKELQKAKFGE